MILGQWLEAGGVTVWLTASGSLEEGALLEEGGDFLATETDEIILLEG